MQLVRCYSGTGRRYKLRGEDIYTLSGLFDALFHWFRVCGAEDRRMYVLGMCRVLCQITSRGWQAVGNNCKFERRNFVSLTSFIADFF